MAADDVLQWWPLGFAYFGLLNPTNLPQSERPKFDGRGTITVNDEGR